MTKGLDTLVANPYLVPVASRRHDAVKLAAKAGVEPRTAGRWLAWQGVRRASAVVLERAAEELGIARDPEPQEQAS